MSGPIPKHLLEPFVAYLDACNNDDLPDGAWWAMLEEAAELFMHGYGLRGCRNSAVHQWNEMRGTKVDVHNR